MCQHRPYLYTNTHSRRAKLLQKLRRILVNSHSFNKLGPEKFLSRTISPRSVLEGSLNGKSTFLVGTYTPRLSWVVLTTFFATAAVFNSALYARYPTYFIWVWCCLVCYLLFHLKVTLIQCSVHRSRTKPTSLTDDCWAGSLKILSLLKRALRATPGERTTAIIHPKPNPNPAGSFQIWLVGWFGTYRRELMPN